MLNLQQRILLPLQTGQNRQSLHETFMVCLSLCLPSFVHSTACKFALLLHSLDLFDLSVYEYVWNNNKESRDNMLLVTP